ncbi:MAG: M20/M25/M40 family metallo-hydrolase, partial [Fusobacteriaceae bacterium]|nr:M20/M25/M40 family metallo-hydrolase [Fusobacteriaceae bacterium]
MKEKMYALADKYYDDIVGTAQEMLRIKSTSGEEGELARYTADKMKELGYDDVNIDAAGNVLGCVRGTGGGKSLMLNCHLDTVEEGDEALWKYGPRSGALAEGKLWGRGASDTKGPFAIQVWVPAILKKEGLLPKGDLWVTGVVHEETSGLGATAMVKDGFHTDFAISGEATEN